MHRWARLDLHMLCRLCAPNSKSRNEECAGCLWRGTRIETFIPLKARKVSRGLKRRRISNRILCGLV